MLVLAASDPSWCLILALLLVVVLVAVLVVFVLVLLLVVVYLVVVNLVQVVVLAVAVVVVVVNLVQVFVAVAVVVALVVVVGMAVAHYRRSGGSGNCRLSDSCVADDPYKMQLVLLLEVGQCHILLRYACNRNGCLCRSILCESGRTTPFL